MSLGEAAGVMAAVFCAGGKPVNALPVEELRAQIAARGFVR